MRYFYSLILYFFLFVITGCGVPKTAVEPVDTRPDWVKQRPTDVRYYIGVGIANKRFHPNDFQEEAKRNALEDLSGEINVQVNANSMLFSIEKDGKFSDEYKSFTQVTSLEKVKNFEVVDSWQNGEEFWILYRLSKAQYAADKEADIQKALHSCKGFLDSSQELKDKGLFKDAIIQKLRAMEAIKPYLGESLQTTYNGKDVYMGNYVRLSIEQLASEFVLIPRQEELSVYWGQSISPDAIQFSLLHDKDPAQGFKVQFSYSERRLTQRNAVTNSDGVAVFNLDKILSEEENQSISARVDMEALYELVGNEKDDWMRKLLAQFQVPTARVKLHVASPKVYVDISGINFNKPGVKTGIETALKKRGFTTVSKKSDADLKVIVNGNTKAEGMQFEMYHVRFDGEFEVVTASNKVLYTEVLAGLKGVQLDAEKAKDRAYNTLVQEVTDIHIPRFKRSLLK